MREHKDHINANMLSSEDIANQTSAAKNRVIKREISEMVIVLIFLLMGII